MDGDFWSPERRRKNPSEGRRRRVGLGLSKASNNIVIFRFSVIGKEDYSEKLIFSEIER